MSRTEHGHKGPGYEYWASRWGRYGEQPGRYTKQETHRKERRDGKSEIRVNPEEARQRAAGGINHR